MTLQELRVLFATNKQTTSHGKGSQTSPQATGLSSSVSFRPPRGIPCLSAAQVYFRACLCILGCAGRIHEKKRCTGRYYMPLTATGQNRTFFGARPSYGATLDVRDLVCVRTRLPISYSLAPGVVFFVTHSVPFLRDVSCNHARKGKGGERLRGRGSKTNCGVAWISAPKNPLPVSDFDIIAAQNFMMWSC